MIAKSQIKNNRAEFLERRRSGIGGSEVAAVLGCSPWKTPYQLWQDKTGQTTDTEETQAMHFGSVLEEVIAQEFAARNSLKIQKRNQMFRHPEYPELIANIDRYVVGGAILECKTSNAFSASKWGNESSDDVPDYYLLQVLHYMYVTGIREAFLAVLIGGNQYRQYEIPYDADLAEFAGAKCREFWSKNVLANCAPEITIGDYKNLAEIYLANPATKIVASTDIIEICKNLAEIKLQKKELENSETEIAFLIKQYMQNAEILTDEADRTIATWKQQKNRTATVTDWEAVVSNSEIPATIIEKYTFNSEKPGNRQLLIK